MKSREEEAIRNKYDDTQLLLYDISISLGRIADMLAEMNRYFIRYDNVERKEDIIEALKKEIEVASERDFKNFVDNFDEIVK